MNTTTSKLSVIIPVYNSEKTLVRCLNSVINQTYDLLEIILIDDGSQDTSQAICKQYCELDSRITLISQKNMGAYAAKKTGINNATGEYIAFVDSDDTISLTAFSDIILIMQNRSVDIVEFGFKVIEEDGRVRRQCSSKKPCTLNGLSEIFKAYYVNHSISTSLWSKVYRRKLFYNVVDLALRRFDDVAIIVQVLYECKSICIYNKILYNYIQNKNGIIATKTQDTMKDEIYISKYLYDYHLHRNEKLALFEAFNVLTTIIHSYALFYKQASTKEIHDWSISFKEYYAVVKQSKLLMRCNYETLQIYVFKFSPKIFITIVRLRAWFKQRFQQQIPF